MEIINKVAQSGLISIDLEEYYVKGPRMLFDLKGWLFEELILKEKDFREKLKMHDWNQYKDAYVAVTCSADAIVPTWAFMLVTTYLQPVAKEVIFGTLTDLEEKLFSDRIDSLDVAPFTGQRIVVKGCSGIPVPVSAYVKLTNKLRPVAKSIMYGEPCRTVPLYKQGKEEK
jgi:hypothetical protein